MPGKKDKTEFSAMSVKRPGGKVEKAEKWGPKSRASKIPGRFFCLECMKDHRDEEIGRDNGPGRKICKACVAKSTKEITSPSRESRQRSHRKSSEKHYKSGKLPPWMLS